MRIRAKRRVDEYVGYPLLFALNILVLLLGLVFRRSHSVQPVDCILILKFQGMGSLALAKPSLAALRRAYPEARIIFWGGRSIAPLAQECPEFDEVVTLDDRGIVTGSLSTLRCLARLWRARIDWAFDLEVYSKLSSILMVLCLPRNRAGFAVNNVKPRKYTHTHLVYFNRYRFMGETYAKLLGLALPEGEIDIAEPGGFRFELEPLSSLPRPYVVLNIHAGELSLERRWPLPRFAALAEALLEAQPETTIVLIGHGEAEVRETASMPRHARILDIAGTLDLPETIRVLANASLVVSNDTAAVHLARCCGAPVVGLYGPTRAATYLPADVPNVVAITEDFYCSPCIHHWEPIPCGGDNQCMQTLQVQRVLEACCSLLGVDVPERPPSDGQAQAPPSSYYAGLVSGVGVAGN